MTYQKIKGNLVHKTAVVDWKNLIIGKNNYIGLCCDWRKCNQEKSWKIILK